MAVTPVDIKALREERLLRIRWSDDRQADLPFVKVRGACNCAGCVDERTGIRTLDVSKIPADLGLEEMHLVGNYAVRIHWTDGHSTGLFTWPHLYGLSDPG